MIIILEGSDASGKSTVATALHDRLPDASMMHCGPLVGDPFIAYEEPLANRHRAMPVIADRWHLGELVYGPMFRGVSQLDDAGRWHVDAFLASRGALLVYLEPPMEVVAGRFVARGDDMVAIEQLAEIRSRYGDVLESKVLHTLHLGCANALNCQGHDHPASVVEEIISDAFTLWTSAAALRQFTTYVGPTNPRYLILGERRNDPEMYTSAFVPTRNSSGHFMLTHMIPAMGDATFGLANACEENIYALWISLGRPNIVTLGNTAYDEAMTQLGDFASHMMIGAVPHPQFVRRFHNKFGAQYARTIISALNTGKDLRSWRPA